MSRRTNFWTKTKKKKTSEIQLSAISNESLVFFEACFPFISLGHLLMCNQKFTWCVRTVRMLSRGVLVMYLAIKQMDSLGGRLPLAKFYFHRYWRWASTCPLGLDWFPNANSATPSLRNLLTFNYPVLKLSLCFSSWPPSLPSLSFLPCLWILALLYTPLSAQGGKVVFLSQTHAHTSLFTIFHPLFKASVIFFYPTHIPCDLFILSKLPAFSLNRLTPSYMFVIMFWTTIYKFFGNSPNWYSQVSNSNCENYWWTNMLYINNFWPKNDLHGVSILLTSKLQLHFAKISKLLRELLFQS